MTEYTFRINDKIKACYSDTYSENGFCLFYCLNVRDGSHHCTLKDEVTCTKSKRPVGCPLVEIQTPHGRLIDADELKSSIPSAEADMFENCRNCTCLSSDELNDIIDDAKTVIEAST